jgi:putative alpha-1,2-mannosidase
MTRILSRREFAALSVSVVPSLWLDHQWTIEAGGEHQAPDRCYVRSAKLNGKILSRAWITHQEIVQGGTLEFVMDSVSNQQWASSEADLPRSMTARRAVAQIRFACKRNAARKAALK